MTESERFEHGFKMVDALENHVFEKFLAKFESDKRYIVTDFDGEVFYETNEVMLAKAYCFAKSVSTKFVVDLKPIGNRIIYVFDNEEWCDIRPFCLREE